MKCDILSTYYSDACEQRLSLEDQKAFDGHLQHCGPCQQDYQRFLEALQFLQANKPTLSLPTTFGSQILESAYRLLFPLRNPRKTWLSGFLLGAVVFGILGILFFSSEGPASSPEATRPGFVYDGKQWISWETFLAKSLTDPTLLEAVKQHPHLQQFVNERVSGSQRCLEQEYLQLKQDGGLPQGIEAFSHLQPELLETLKNHEMASFLYHSSIGNGFFLQGFFFYPVFLEKDQQKSFLDLSSALQQGLLNVSAGEQAGFLRLRSFASRPLIVRTGEVLSSPRGDYIFKKTGVLEPQGSETFPVMAYANPLGTDSWSPSKVRTLPPSLLAALFSSEEAFHRKIQKLLALFDPESNTHPSSTLSHLYDQKEFQAHCKKLLQLLPYPKNPAPSGWFILRQNQILYGEIFSDPDQMEMLFPERIESLLMECATRFGCLEHEEQRQNWPIMQNIFLHKQRLQNALQKTLALDFQIQSLTPQMKLALLYPEKPLGLGISWNHQWIQFQLFQDPNQIENENTLPLSYQELWKKLIQTETIELQEQLLQQLIIRLSEEEFQGLWNTVSHTSDLKQQQIFLRFLLKRRPPDCEKRVEQWLTAVWNQKTSFELALQLIDALSLTKYTPSVPLLLELLQSTQNPLKNRLHCLEAIKTLYPQAPEDLQKRIHLGFLQWGKILQQAPPSEEHSILSQELLKVCAHISGQVHPDLDAYWELWAR